MLNDRHSSEVSAQIALKLTNGYDVYGTEDGVIIVQAGDKKSIAQGQGKILAMAELPEGYLATAHLGPFGRFINIWNLNDLSKKPKSIFTIPLDDKSWIKTLEVLDKKLICSTDSGKHQIELDQILKKCKAKESSVGVTKKASVHRELVSAYSIKSPVVHTHLDKEQAEACRQNFNSSLMRFR